MMQKKSTVAVIPAKAGISKIQLEAEGVKRDSCLHRNDGVGAGKTHSKSYEAEKNVSHTQKRF